jgi:RimJ/RimL family protein N-acetyltransferase
MVRSKHQNHQSLFIRRGLAADADDVYQWRLDNLAIKNSKRTRQTFDRTAHQRWFDQLLADPMRSLYIGCTNGMSVGLVRFDTKKNRRVEVSIIVAPQFRGHGLSKVLLESAIQVYLNGNSPIFEATVAKINVPSARCFHKNGFYLAKESRDYVVLARHWSGRNVESDWKIIEAIQSIRRRNNTNWMDILKLALSSAPDEAMELLQRISDDDARVNMRLKDLTDKK